MSSIHLRDLIAAARDLSSDDGRNVEYDRALVELVSTVAGVGTEDGAREIVSAAVLKVVPA